MGTQNGWKTYSMTKRFSPVRIQNPTSLQQFVKVGPGQEISMYLDNEIYGEYAVDVSTDFLTVDAKPHKNGKLYTIKHSNLIHDWAEYSSAMIGEIWVDGQKSIGKVGVLLETTNTEKTNVKTVVNPDSLDLRMYPYNILEVIVYDNRFGFHDEWSFDWQPVKDVGLEQLGYDHLCFNSWEHYYNGLEPTNYLYARYPRGESQNGMLTRQHHFWFRLDNKSFALMAKENSVVHIGNIVVSGISNRYQLQYADKMSYHLSLYVDFRKKCYKQLQDTISIKQRNECTPTRVMVYAPAKKVLPEIRDVDIKLVETPGQITGCKTLSTLNENYKPSIYWDQWESDIHLRECDIDFTPFQFGYPNKNHNQWRRELD